MPALPARASPPDSGRFERHRLTTRVRPQNFQNLYDPNSAYDFNSARFLVLSENQPKTAIHQIVACSKGTMAAIFTTALAKKPAFLRRQFRKKYDRKKVRNIYGRELKRRHWGGVERLLALSHGWRVEADRRPMRQLGNPSKPSLCRFNPKAAFETATERRLEDKPPMGIRVGDAPQSEAADWIANYRVRVPGDKAQTADQASAHATVEANDREPPG